MHIAVIPAREGSKGLPFKNRMFFDMTADFIDTEAWFQQVIVSTDDDVIIEKATDRGYSVHHRTKDLSGDAVSIKSVFIAIINDLKISADAFLWLFYLPNLYKDPLDFRKARDIMDKGEIVSLCGLVPAKTHPFNCYRYDGKTGELEQYVKNDVYRRQDLPDAWMLHHYVCCFRAKELNNLNNELVNNETYPFFIDRKTSDNLIEVDTPEDYERWKSLSKEEK